MTRICTLCCLLFVCMGSVADEPRLLESKFLHLRIDGEREWESFPNKSDANSLKVTFDAKENRNPMTLRLRQADIKQTWNVRLNGKDLARLERDENDMVVYFPIDKGMLRTGENTLSIEQSTRRKTSPDDVRVGEVWLDSRPISEVLSEGTISVEVREYESGRLIPARITIVNKQGALHTVGAKSNDHLAVRPGTVYTATGKATFGLPAGEYTLYAGRGFEYSLATTKMIVRAGVSITKKLRIDREVPTQGYVACDTHVHTLTHSGHGDATVQERMISLAAEGIELPIATDHNVHIDHRPFAKTINVRQYFTPIIGNEVTTKVGHFNIFPVKAGSAVPDYKSTDWPTIFSGIYKTPDVKVCILNHARDLHSGVRPFGPKWHIAVAGQNLDGRNLEANAMEVVNSSASQSDPLQLFHDWMGMLNRGRFLTPVGSSDSHDVARHFVGQGRTYIRCDDRDPGNISIDQAVQSFLQGRVMVSYGLAVELTVDRKYGMGELAPVVHDKVRVEASVLGPHWVSADRIELFANGTKVREEVIAKELRDLPAGVKWSGVWMLDQPKHDVHLVAIASGPGIDGLYWKSAKPYQPTTPKWNARSIGCSGPIWLDADANGRRTPAYDYARQLVARSGGDIAKLVGLLADFDEAIAVQAASLFPGGAAVLYGPKVESMLESAPKHVRDGLQAYREAWRKSEVARSR